MAKKTFPKKTIQAMEPVHEIPKRGNGRRDPKAAIKAPVVPAIETSADRTRQLKVLTDQKAALEAAIARGDIARLDAGLDIINATLAALAVKPLGGIK